MIDYVLSLGTCSRAHAPLEFFSELRVEKDGSQLLQLFLPLFALAIKASTLGLALLVVVVIDSILGLGLETVNGWEPGPEGRRDSAAS
jgi:hypothetical protein